MTSYLTPRQLAERWSCHPSHVRSLCASGELRAMRLGVKSWRISEAAAAEYEYAHSAPEIGGPEPANTTSAETASSSSTTNEGLKEEVRAPVTVDGFALPADYEPVFPELWGMEPATHAGKKKTALPH